MAEQQKTESLPVKLNADEIEINARALGAAHAKKKEIEEVLAQQKSHAKQQLEALDTEIGSRSRIAVTGFESRPVPVQYGKDFKRGIVTTTRLDTFEVIGARPMTPAERQQGLFGEDDHTPAVDPSRYAADTDHFARPPSKKVADVAKQVFAEEARNPGFIEHVVKPPVAAKAKAKRGGKQPSAE